MYEMTEEHYDQAFLVSETIAQEVTYLVRSHLEGLTRDQKEYVLDRLGDNYRFWSALE